MRRDIMSALDVFVGGGVVDSTEESASIHKMDVDNASQIRVLAAVSLQILRNCLGDDVADMLSSAGKHLINASYLGENFLEKGIDIAHGLADIISAFKAREFRALGNSTGALLY